MCKDPRQDSDSNLYGDAMLVPNRMDTSIVAGDQQKHLSLFNVEYERIRSCLKG